MLTAVAGIIATPVVSAPKAFYCFFDRGVAAFWSDKGVEPYELTNQRFSFVITDLDPTTNKALLVEGGHVSDLTILHGFEDGIFIFVDATPTWSQTLTSIDSRRPEDAVNAIYSRHTIAVDLVVQSRSRVWAFAVASNL